MEKKGWKERLWDNTAIWEEKGEFTRIVRVRLNEGRMSVKKAIRLGAYSQNLPGKKYDMLNILINKY